LNKSKDGERINEMIRHPKLRLILEDGKQYGIVSSEEALKIALERGYDLVEISPDANPPVCKVMDYGKYRYEKIKKEKEARRKQKQHQITVKELKIRPKIDEHDYNVKIKHIKRFLADGDKVKIVIRYRGREMMYQEHGIELLKQILEDIKDYCEVEKAFLEIGKPQMVILAPLNNQKQGGDNAQS
jgi:translation initiation factor IF-3